MVLKVLDGHKCHQGQMSSASARSVPALRRITTAAVLGNPTDPALAWGASYCIQRVSADFRHFLGGGEGIGGEMA